MKQLTVTATASLLLCSAALASNLLLPNPAGSQIIAGWVGTNAHTVPAPTAENPNATALEWDGPWTSTTNLAATYTSVGGNFRFNTSLPFNAMAPSSIYSLNSINSSYSLSASDYAGPAIDKLILQLTPNANNDRHLGLNPSLTIGGITYTADQASATIVNNYGGTQSQGSILDNPNSQYHGTYGLLALLTYEWDLSALGYSGSYEDFSVDWIFPQSHSALFEAQLSVIPVPEPSTFALLAAGLALLAVGICRRKPAVQSAKA